MKPEYINEHSIKLFITSALKEDVGVGDHSSLASIPATEVNEAKLLIKDNGIIAGLELAEHIFKTVDENLELKFFINDGDSVKKGDVALTVKGKAQSILTAERLVLNCLQRMSGIATYTNQLQSLIQHTAAKVLDTRKTTPNFRMCEKWAVKIGGGENHRYGLFDMIILKDNHIDYSGGIKNAITNTVNYVKNNKLSIKIEVETRSLIEVEKAVETGGIHRIMLDNMTIDEMKKAVAIINHRFETEASGGITEQNIVQVAETGVDFISIGALTHSYKSLDLSLKAL